MTNGARSPRGFPHIVSDILSKKHAQCWVGVNKGINGQTSCDLINRVFQEMKGTSEAHEVILTIGSNDAKDSVATPLDIYAANWRYFVNCAVFLKKKLYIGLIPDMIGFGAPDYSSRCNDRIKEYNHFLRKEYASKYPLVDFTGMGPESYIDGVHCNLHGYTEMANRFAAVIESERLIGLTEEKAGDDWKINEPMRNGKGASHEQNL